jgi:hypothetical protein
LETAATEEEGSCDDSIKKAFFLRTFLMLQEISRKLLLGKED